MNSATLLTVMMTFCLAVSMIWIVVGYTLQLSFTASLQWSLGNALGALGLLIWLLNEAERNTMQQFYSDFFMLISFCWIRRGIQSFTNQKKTDAEQLLVAFAGTLIFFVLQDQDLIRARTCAFSALCGWTICRTCYEAYVFMGIEFNFKVVTVVTAPFFMMGTGYWVRMLVNAAGLDSANGDFWVNSTYNGLFLLGCSISLYTFNMALAFLTVSRLVLQLKNLVSRDPLTNLNNRRQIQLDLQDLIDAMPKTQKTFSLVMIDLDKFKSINDTRGHSAGDAVLKRVSSVFERVTGKRGTAGRLGGEEFCIIVPNSCVKEAVKVAEDVRQAVESEPMAGEEGDFFITASMGVATCVSHEEGWSNVMKRADVALYSAKINGRNRVTVANSAWVKQQSAPDQNKPSSPRARKLVNR